MSRELKLALVVGFCVVMVVAVLVSDHLSKANKAQLATGSEPVPTVIAANMPEKPLPGLEDFLPKSGIPSAAQNELVESVPSAVAPETKPAPEAAPASPDTVTPGTAGMTIKAPAPSTPSASPVPVMPKTVAMAPQGESIPAITKQPDLANKPEVKKTEPALLTVRTGPVPGEKSHTIGEGDTLFKICKKYYGDGNLWKQLATYNSGKLGKDGTLKTNAVLAIPPREVLTGKASPNTPVTAPVNKPADPKASKPKTELAAKPAEKAKPKVTTYTIKPGDTIGVISRKLLGTSKRAQEIIDLNASSPSFSEDDLTPGMTIKVPAA